MNWKNVRIFMVALLLLADIFLAVTLILQKNDTLYDKETLKDIKDLLAESGIEADDKFLRTEKQSDFLYRADISDYESYLSGKFMTGGISETFTTPNGIKIFGTSGDELSITNIFEIRYTSASFFPSEDSLDETITSSSELKDIEERILKTIFTEKEREEYSLSLFKAKRSGDFIFAYLTQTVGGRKIENSTLTCCIEGDKLLYLSGKCCFMPIDSKSTAHLLDSVNILFIEKSEIDEAEKENLQKNSKKIENMEICSWAYITKDRSQILFIPSWHIEWDSGDSSYYNAIDGKKHTIMN